MAEAWAWLEPGSDQVLITHGDEIIHLPVAEVDHDVPRDGHARWCEVEDQLVICIRKDAYPVSRHRTVRLTRGVITAGAVASAPVAGLILPWLIQVPDHGPDMLNRLGQALVTAIQQGRVAVDTVDDHLYFRAIHEESMSGWAAAAAAVMVERDRQASINKRGREEAEVRRTTQDYWADQQTSGFVNPYNFVPIPAGSTVDRQRHRPAGHCRQDDTLLTGAMTFTAKAITPVLLHDHEATVAGERTSVPVQLPDGRVDVWGSSLKGSLRSAFEVITGSCLRILTNSIADTVYRDPARPREHGWRLGVVKAVDADGIPASIAPCSETIWVPIEAFPNRATTGEIYKVRGRRQRVADRLTVPDAEVNACTSPEAEDAFVVLVTDLNARSDKEINHRLPTWAWAMGRLGDSDACPVNAKAARLFEVEVRQSRASILTRANRPWPAEKDTSRTIAPGQPTSQGRFRPATRDSLIVGTPVWCKVEDGQVVRFAPSYLWRTHPATAASVADRLDRGNLACTDPDRLCPACRVFGTVIDREGDERDGNRQESYRGQLRPVTLRSDARVDLSVVTKLAPMGEPRPGNAQNYFGLQRAGQTSASPESRPLRELGGVADKAQAGQRPAPLNGVKRWWMTSRLPEGRGRQRWSRLRNGSGESNMNRSARLVPADTPFTGTLAFVNLTRSEIAAVAAALDPGVLETRTQAHGWHLGGGKPIGLGVMQTTSIKITTWTAAQRYLDGVDTVWTEDEVQRLTDELRCACPEGARTAWDAFLTLTAVDHVPGEIVTYPVKLPGDVRPTDGGYLDRVRPDPAYSSRTAGMYEASKPLSLLPPATDPKLAQPLGRVQRAQNQQGRDGRRR